VSVSRAAKSLRYPLKAAKLGDVRFELGNRLRRGGPVEETLLMGFQLPAGVLSEGKFFAERLETVSDDPTGRTAELLFFSRPSRQASRRLNDSWIAAGDNARRRCRI